MEYRQSHLRDDMLRRDQVDVVDIADLLQFDVPFGKLFGREIEAVPSVGNVVVLAEDASEVAAGEEDGPGAIVALDAGLYVPSTTWNTGAGYKSLPFAVTTLTLTKVRSNNIDLHRLCTDQADSRLLVAVHSA